MDNNIITKLFEILENRIGKRLLKQLCCVLLLIFEIDKDIIIDKLGVSRITIKKYSNLIQKDNIEEIFCDNVYRRKSELEDYTDIILSTLDKNPPKTLREAAVIIEKLTGLKRSTNQISNYLKKKAIKGLE